jgi:type IV fimbrial biogenesis protein FimT
LIELMVGLVLLGILVGLGLPSFTAWIRNSQVRTVAEATQNGVRLAQAESVRRNRTVVFSLTNATPSSAATAVAGGRNWSMQTVPLLAGETAEYIRGGALADVASGVVITATTDTATPATVNAVCFNSNGRLVASTSTGVTNAVCSAVPVRFDFAQTNADRPLRVTVAVGGQVRLCDPARTRSTTSPDGC